MGKNNKNLNHQLRGTKAFLLSLLLFLTPTAVYSFPFAVNNATDTSAIFLGDIFGTLAGGKLLAGGNGLLGDLFSIFNLVILTLGTLVVVYSIIMSTVNTAQEGEAMGRKWGSSLIPLRAGIGLAMLLPVPQYSIIQFIVITVILQGVGLGNTVWNKVLNFVETQGSITGTNLPPPPPAPSVESGRLDTMAEMGINSILCMDAINKQNEADKKPERISVKRSIDGKKIIIGYGSTGEECGSFEPGGHPVPLNGNITDWNNTQLDAIETFLSKLTPPLNIDDVIDAKSATISVIKSYYNPNTYAEEYIANQFQQAQKEGWIYASTYYFELIDPAGGINANRAPKTSYFTPTFTQGTLNTPEQAQEAAKLKAPDMPQQSNQDSYIDLSILKSTDSIGNTCTGAQSKFSPLKIDPPFELESENVAVDFALNWLQKPFNYIWDSAFNGFNNIFESLRKKVMCDLLNKEDDPLNSMKAVGRDILRATDILFFVILVCVVVLFLSSCVGTVLSPICFIVGGVFAIIAPMLMFLIVALYTSGILFTLYIPLIPYIVFTFSAIGWLVLCVEAVVAAPIVSLGIVSPAQHVMGKAAPSITILTNILLRPGLMIVGLVAAASLSKAFSRILMETFELTLQTTIGNYGIFAMLAIIAVFVGLITSIYHKIFSLIYVLPDRIVRWIGGQAEQTGRDVEGALQEAQSSTEKGAKIGADIAKAGMAVAGEVASEAYGKSKEDMGGGFGWGGHSAHSERGQRRGYRFDEKTGASMLPGGVEKTGEGTEYVNPLKKSPKSSDDVGEKPKSTAKTPPESTPSGDDSADDGGDDIAMGEAPPPVPRRPYAPPVPPRKKKAPPLPPRKKKDSDDSGDVPMDDLSTLSAHKDKPLPPPPLPPRKKKDNDNKGGSDNE